MSKKLTDAEYKRLKEELLRIVNEALEWVNSLRVKNANDSDQPRDDHGHFAESAGVPCEHSNKSKSSPDNSSVSNSNRDNVHSSGSMKVSKSAIMQFVKINPKNYTLSDSGTIVPTIVRTGKTHADTHVPSRGMKPFEVIQNIAGKNNQVNRSLYDENGNLSIEFHSKDHSPPEKANKPQKKYKNPNGAHIHEHVNGIRVEYSDGSDGRDLTAEEEKYFGDLL